MRLSVVLMSFALLALAACKTTGDPRQGGLFGWSEKKAQQRQQSMRADADAADTALAREQDRSANLHTHQAELSRDEQRLQIELSRLLNENERLEQRLRELVQQRRFDGTRLAQLRAVLADNERLRERAAPQGDTTNSLWPQLELIDSQNQRLHREIFALLQ